MKKEKESVELFFFGNIYLFLVFFVVFCVIRVIGCSEKLVVGLERFDCYR